MVPKLRGGFAGQNEWTISFCDPVPPHAGLASIPPTVVVQSYACNRHWSPLARTFVLRNLCRPIEPPRLRQT
jgi:hypothetical protein